MPACVAVERACSCWCAAPAFLLPKAASPTSCPLPCIPACSAEAPQPAPGLASADWQLYLLEVLQQCLPRIRRRALHFLAEQLHMALRWARQALHALPLGDPTSCAPASDASSNNAGTAQEQQELMAAGAVARLAHMAAATAAWVEQQAEGAMDQQAAQGLLGLALLQQASLVMQLPQTLQAADAAVAAAARAHPASGGAAAPAAGSRLPLMHAAAEQLLQLPAVLLRQVPSTAGSGGEGSAAGTRSPEDLQQLAAAAEEHLAGTELQRDELSHFSAAAAAEGAAAAACAACTAPGADPRLQAQRLRQLLPAAASLLLDAGAAHQSVALTLLPLGALCQAGRDVAASAGAPGAADCRLTASSPALDGLLSGLVGVMSHNPVQLVRSCAHDAVQALLDALAPAARLAQLQALAQVGRCVGGHAGEHLLPQHCRGAGGQVSSPCHPPSLPLPPYPPADAIQCGSGCGAAAPAPRNGGCLGGSSRAAAGQRHQQQRRALADRGGAAAANSVPAARLGQRPA